MESKICKRRFFFTQRSLSTGTSDLTVIEQIDNQHNVKLL